MSGPAPRPKPRLTDFVGAFVGPVPTEYRGGVVKIIAAFAYSDGVLIEWLVDPVPDLTWMSDEVPNPDRTAFLDRFRDQPEMVDRLRRSRRLSTFWESATLRDDVGTRYEWAGGDSESADGKAYKGHETFSPSVPSSAHSLTIDVHGLAMTIALEGGSNF
jgi:hypothetical protein